MGTVEVITIGSTNVSVYALTADPAADLEAYWAVRIGVLATAFAAASAEDKLRALAMASDWIDRASTFSGTKTNPAQALAWPRDSAVCGTETIADGTTPDDVANAAFFLSGFLISSPDASESSGQGSNLKRAKAGSAEVEFFERTNREGDDSDTRLPRVAVDLLSCFFGGDSGVGNATAFGTSSSSAFDDCDFRTRQP